MDKQIIFIDDSGDPGFKKGSSRFFVIACVIFDNEAQAVLAAAIMAAQIRRLGWHDSAEFKFHRTQKKHILTLLKQLSGVDFKIVAILVDKSKLNKKTKPGTLYNETIRNALLLCNPEGAKVRLDGHSGHNYMRNAVSYFRKSINTKEQKRKIIHFRFVDSTKNTPIQLADIAAGSILRSANPAKTDSQDYIKALKDKIILIKTTT